MTKCKTNSNLSFKSSMLIRLCSLPYCNIRITTLSLCYLQALSVIRPLLLNPMIIAHVMNSIQLAWSGQVDMIPVKTQIQ